MSVAISVLVPVYNVESTLDRCMQSILRQTFQNFEVILVDDGSTDRSGEICDQYAEKYEKVRVIHKKNEGLGPTRNRGIREAAGDYIYHCDSDDWLKEDLLEKAYAAISAANANVAVFGYDIFTERDGRILPYDSIQVEANIYEDRDSALEFFAKEYFHGFVVLSACNRMCRCQFLIDNELFFPPMRRCQDMAYSLLLFDHIERLVTIRESYYCYIIEPGVFKGRAFDEMIQTYCTVYEMTAGYFKRWNLLQDQTKQELVNYACEQMANYSAYALAVKYKSEWKQNARNLIENKKIREYFAEYKNMKQSKFMTLFCIGMRIRSPRFLLLVSKLAQRVQATR